MQSTITRDASGMTLRYESKVPDASSAMPLLQERESEPRAAPTDRASDKYVQYLPVSV